MRIWKRTRNLARKNIKKPFKAWTKFARQQYEQARHPDGSDTSDGDEDSNSESGEDNKDDEDGDKHHHSESRSRNGEKVTDSGSDADDEAPPSPSRRHEPNTEETPPPPLPPRVLRPDAEKKAPPLHPRNPAPIIKNQSLPLSTPNQPPSNRTASSPSPIPPANNETEITTSLPKTPSFPLPKPTASPTSSSSRCSYLYKHRAKPGQPPVQAPYVRQYPVDEPCTCTLPANIDHKAHLTGRKTRPSSSLLPQPSCVHRARNAISRTNSRSTRA